MLTIRISQDTEKKLVQYCEDEGVTKSTVVKEALAMYLSQKQKSKSAFDAGADLFGQAGSSDNDRSVTFKQRLKSKLNEKHAH